MGKTSPFTGTGKKTKKEIEKANKYLAKETVKESIRGRPGKRHARELYEEVRGGKHLPTTELGDIMKRFERAYSGTQGMFDKQKEQALHDFQTSVLPAVSQQFGGSEVKTSSALRQALFASASNLARGLESDFSNQRMNLAGSFMNQAEQGKLNALNARLQASNALMGNAPAPFNAQVQNAYNQKQGGTSGMGGTIVGGLLSAGGAYAGSEAGAAAITAGLSALSSKEIKQNIREYEKGLEIIRKLGVKQYDYTIPIDGRADNRIGLIAEDVPDEVQTVIGAVKAVDVYGLVGLLINCVKQLDTKVKMLEAR